MQLKNKGFLILQVQSMIAVIFMIYIVLYEVSHEYQFINLVFGIVVILLITTVLIKQSCVMHNFIKGNFTIISLPSMKIANGMVLVANAFLVAATLLHLVSFSISSLVCLFVIFAYMQTDHPTIALSKDTLYFVSRKIQLDSIRKMDTSKIKKKYTTVYVFTKRQFAASIPDDVCDQMRKLLNQFEF